MRLHSQNSFSGSVITDTGLALSALQFAANPLWDRLSGPRTTVDDLTWMTAVGLQGANRILDDLARTFGVTP